MLGDKIKVEKTLKNAVAIHDFMNNTNYSKDLQQMQDRIKELEEKNKTLEFDKSVLEYKCENIIEQLEQQKEDVELGKAVDLALEKYGRVSFENFIDNSDGTIRTFMYFYENNNEKCIDLLDWYK